MKTLGILGGMSWESSAHLYRLLNQDVAARLGGLHSADLLLRSVDFAQIEALQRAGDWAAAGQMLGEAGRGLKAAGAQGLLIATNTMHKVADALEAGSGLPLLHIADATAAALQAAGVQQALLLGTRYTMEDSSIVRSRLQQRAGLHVQVPDAAGQALLQRVVFDELVRGIVNPASRALIVALIAHHAAQGAQAVVLGCTELMLMLDDSNSPLPTFDTTALHCASAVQWMVGETPTPCPPETPA